MPSCCLVEICIYRRGLYQGAEHMGVLLGHQAGAEVGPQKPITRTGIQGGPLVLNGSKEKRINKRAGRSDSRL